MYNFIHNRSNWIRKVTPKYLLVNYKIWLDWYGIHLNAYSVYMEFNLDFAVICPVHLFGNTVHWYSVQSLIYTFLIITFYSLCFLCQQTNTHDNWRRWLPNFMLSTTQLNFITMFVDAVPSCLNILIYKNINGAHCWKIYCLIRIYFSVEEYLAHVSAMNLGIKKWNAEVFLPQHYIFYITYSLLKA